MILLLMTQGGGGYVGLCFESLRFVHPAHKSRDLNLKLYQHLVLLCNYQ